MKGEIEKNEKVARFVFETVVPKDATPEEIEKIMRAELRYFVFEDLLEPQMIELYDSPYEHSEDKGDEIIIKVKTLIAPEVYEKLEETLRKCLVKFGVSAVIEDTVTGNTTVCSVCDKI